MVNRILTSRSDLQTFYLVRQFLNLTDLDKSLESYRVEECDSRVSTLFYYVSEKSNQWGTSMSVS